MTEMLERVARAIRDAQDEWLDTMLDQPEPVNVLDYMRGWEAAMARAAIQAMREPTKEMAEAGRSAVDSTIDPTTDLYCSYIIEAPAAWSAAAWAAMLAAALGEAP